MALEEALTKAEREALKKRIRGALVDSVLEELDGDIHDAAVRVLRAEIKAMKADKGFMEQLRHDFREMFRERVAVLAKNLNVYCD